MDELNEIEELEQELANKLRKRTKRRAIRKGVTYGYTVYLKKDTVDRINELSRRIGQDIGDLIDEYIYQRWWREQRAIKKIQNERNKLRKKKRESEKFYNDKATIED